jgi:cysteine desulfuration protein SufE
MSIEEKLKYFEEDLLLFEEETQKYEYIIDIGKNLKLLKDEDKVDSNLVKGCSSNVWVTYTKDEEKYYFHFDSEAIIVKGLCKIIQDIFNGQKKEDILNCDLQILSVLNMEAIISSNRQNGVKGMIEKIKEYVQND